VRGWGTTEGGTTVHQILKFLLSFVCFSSY